MNDCKAAIIHDVYPKEDAINTCTKKWNNGSPESTNFRKVFGAVNLHEWNG